MEPIRRQLRWIFAYRVATLAAVAFLLPPMVPASWPCLPVLALGALALLAAWQAPWLRPGGAHAVAQAIALATEGVLIFAAAFAFGGPSSPITLLALPTLAHGAVLLPSHRYIPTAGAVLVAFAVLVAATHGAAATPFWLPLWVAAIALTAVWLGVAAAVLRRDRALALAGLRRDQAYRQLVEALPPIATGAQPEAADGAFWQRFLAQVQRGGGFHSVALVRWDGPRPAVLATDRDTSWERLARRHLAVFRTASHGGVPQVFTESGAGARAIVCWPVPRRREGVAGALCVMVDAAAKRGAVGRRLRRYLPLAALALALGTPRLALHRQSVDWRTVVNATLHRLHGKLAQYLVLVHVEPGQIEADALLLADAIAHVIEEVLAHTPRQTPVRVTVRRDGGGWHFQVQTPHAPAAHEQPGGPGLQLARQVVSAHGGAWEEAQAASSGYRIGFVLPAAPSGQGTD